MKGTRETPMLAESMDVLDRIPSNPRGWAGLHTPDDGARLPDDSPERPARPLDGSAEAASTGAEHAAPAPRAPAHRRAPAIGEAATAARRAAPLARMIEAEVVPRL